MYLSIFLPVYPYNTLLTAIFCLLSCNISIYIARVAISEAPGFLSDSRGVANWLRIGHYDRRVICPKNCHSLLSIAKSSSHPIHFWIGRKVGKCSANWELFFTQETYTNIFLMGGSIVAIEHSAGSST